MDDSHYVSSLENAYDEENDLYADCNNATESCNLKKQNDYSSYNSSFSPRKQVTIFDVAKLAGVSKSLVSRVMRGEGGVSASKADVVRKAAKELGYVPSAIASSLASSNGRFLGLILRNAKLPFYGYLHTAMQRRARERGYQIVAISGVDELSAQDVQDAFRDLIAFRVAGMIVCSAALTADDFRPFVNRIPIIVAGHEEETKTVSSVYCDEIDGGRKLAQYVMDYGHKNVAVFVVDESYSFSQHRRGITMIEQLKAAGLNATSIEVISPDYVGDAVEEALRKPYLTALMCPSDPFMIRVMGELRNRGISVPNDISVSGYDGIGDLSASYLNFTTYRQPLDKIGYRAVDAIFDAMAGNVETRNIPIAGELIPGCTVRSPHNKC